VNGEAAEDTPVIATEPPLPDAAPVQDDIPTSCHGDSQTVETDTRPPKKSAEEWCNELDSMKGPLKSEVGCLALHLVDEHPELVFDVHNVFVGRADGYQQSPHCLVTLSLNLVPSASRHPATHCCQAIASTRSLPPTATSPRCSAILAIMLSLDLVPSTSRHPAACCCQVPSHPPSTHRHHATLPLAAVRPSYPPCLLPPTTASPCCSAILAIMLSLDLAPSTSHHPAACCSQAPSHPPSTHRHRATLPLAAVRPSYPPAHCHQPWHHPAAQ
jgi:hypothetical protein